jgi:hypothetical protein
MKHLICIAFTSFFMAAGLAATHAQAQRANIFAARMSGGATADSLLFSLDTTPIRCQYGQPYVWDTVHGSIQNVSADTAYLGFKITGGPNKFQWVIRTEIAGSPFIVGSVAPIRIGPHDILPMRIIIGPYPEGPDTESVCFTLLSLPDSIAQEHCIPLYIYPTSSVSLQGESLSKPHEFYPNPFRLSSTLVLTPEQSAQKASIKIYDDAGREMTNRFSIRISSDSVIVERQNVPPGSYIYRLLSKVSSQPSGVIGTGKFIVQ